MSEDCITVYNAKYIKVFVKGKYNFPDEKRFIRWFYEQLYGPLEEDEIVVQTCHNNNCINKHHLKAVTKCEEMKRIVREYSHIGQRVRRNYSKLSVSDVLFLQENKASLTKTDYEKLGKEKGMHPNYLRAVAAGRYWKDIKEQRRKESGKSKAEGK